MTGADTRWSSARPRPSRQVRVGSVPVGGGAPVSIQSMTNTDTGDADATLAQIRALSAGGCEIIRVAVADAAVLPALERIAAESPLPVIADVHFDADLAVAAVGAGCHGLRINPGNIGDAAVVRRITEAAGGRGVPLRIGVNAGSLQADVLERYGTPCADALVDSALQYCALVEEAGWKQIKVSLKSSDVQTTVAAYRRLARESPYALHLGVTEAGTPGTGTVKSAVALGTLLLDGIGDTVRVSLTAPPIEEVRVARQILEAVGLRQAWPEIVACPTCGRTRIDLIRLVRDVEAGLADLRREGLRCSFRKVAIMGCVVNGPGEARDADLGIAGGPGKGVLFRGGEVVRAIPEDQLLASLMREIRAHAVSSAGPA